MADKPKVLILCGGMGTRLREETEYKPKPLVEIGGMPIGLFNVEVTILASPPPSGAIPPMDSGYTSVHVSGSLILSVSLPHGSLISIIHPAPAH